MNISFDLSEYKEPSIKDRIENSEYSIKYIDKGIQKQRDLMQMKVISF